MSSCGLTRGGPSPNHSSGCDPEDAELRVRRGGRGWGGAGGEPHSHLPQLFLPWGGGIPGRCHTEGFISGSQFCQGGLCVCAGAGAALHGMWVPGQGAQTWENSWGRGGLAWVWGTSPSAQAVPPRATQGQEEAEAVSSPLLEAQAAAPYNTPLF